MVHYRQWRLLLYLRALPTRWFHTWSIWKRQYGPRGWRCFILTLEMIWLYGKAYCVAWCWSGLPLFQLGLLGRRLILRLDGFGTLVPVIQIVQTGGHAMADRYAYVPLIGVFIIIAWGLPGLMAKWRYKKKVLSLAVGICIPILMAMTWVQVGHWKDSETLFKHTIRITDSKYLDLALTHNNLGIVLEEKGRINEAITQYRTAMKVKPDFALPHNNLGNIMYSMQETEEAIAYYKSALKLNPDYAIAHNNLGIALEEKGELEGAIDHYREAVRLEPELVLAHYNLGIVLKEKGEFEEAIAHYGLAIKFKPDFALAHNNLGNTLLAMREPEKAIVHYRLAIKIDPNLVLARNNLKVALLQLDAVNISPPP